MQAIYSNLVLIYIYIVVSKFSFVHKTYPMDKQTDIFKLAYHLSYAFLCI